MFGCPTARAGGDKRDRTADLLNAIQALSRLSYTPVFHSKIIISNIALFVNIIRKKHYGKFSTKKGLPKESLKEVGNQTSIILITPSTALILSRFASDTGELVSISITALSPLERLAIFSILIPSPEITPVTVLIILGMFL